MKWLTVEGCPRSGTTILGIILNSHSEITLFHEFNEHMFFTILDMLFSEEERLCKVGPFDENNILPQKEKHTTAIIEKIFEAVGGKTPSIVGTKFPGAHLWPQSQMPEQLCCLHIVAVRNPAATVCSYIQKMQCDGVPVCDNVHLCDIALADWISAWNYAVRNQHDPQYMIIQYEKITFDARLPARVASFLEIASVEELDFSLFSSTSKSQADYDVVLGELGYGNRLKALRTIVDAYAAACGSCYRIIGWPYYVGDTIDCALNAADWQWLEKIAQGFYPAEEDGRWIRGHKAEISLTLLSNLDEYFILHMSVGWVFTYEGHAPCINILLNGQHVAKSTMSLEEKNGVQTRFMWPIRFDPLPQGSNITITIECENPQNPMQLGLSDDDRELSIMIRSLRLENFIAGKGEKLE